MKNFLHIYQLKDYSNIRYLKYFHNKKIIIFILNFLLFITQLIVRNFWFDSISSVVILIPTIYCFSRLIISKKTPLKLTAKLKRIYFIGVVILFACAALIPFACVLNFVILFIPILAKFFNIYDIILNTKFIKIAQQKLNNYKPKIIAITGSNGKTSTKNILFDFLKTTYKVLASPASYNTPLGIAKFINENLNSKVDYIILEYGARHKNDIKKLCQLYGADYGIITTIAPQHLESFKSINNIINAKNELCKFLKNLPCIFNSDNLESLQMYQQKPNVKKLISLYTVADLQAKNVTISNGITYFDIVYLNRIYSCQTSLLGHHNVTNILLATALALYLEVDIKDITNCILNLKPSPHRLELIKTNINILDDSYNCSIKSATEALRVLKTFAGKKMIATPGIIEGGKNQYQINFRLGQMMNFCDFIVVIGDTNKKAILDGLKSLNTTSKIIISNSLNEAKSHFSLLADNDILLLLNDLPDDYQ